MGIRIVCHLAISGFSTVLFSSKNAQILLEKIKRHLRYILPSYELLPILEKISFQKCDYKSGLGLEKIATCDWGIESIIEEINAKKTLFKHIEKFRKKGGIVSSNTSSIPAHLMLLESSADF